MLAVCFPFRQINLCRTTENKTSIVVVVVFGLIIYLFNLKASGIKMFDSKNKCVSVDKWVIFSIYMTIIDIILTMIVPFIIISVINTLIAAKLTKFSCKGTLRKRRKNSDISFVASKFDSSNYSIAQFKSSFKSTSTRIDHIRLSIPNNNNNNNVARKSFTPSINLQIPDVNVDSMRLRSIKPPQIQRKAYASFKTQFTYERSYSTCSFSLIPPTELNSRRQSKVRNNSSVSKYHLSDKSISNRSHRNKIYSRTTKVLLSISTCFLVLVRICAI
jgi:hypothetical protein